MISTRLEQLRSDLREVQVGRMLGLPFSLPFALQEFFRHPVNLARLQEVLKRELENREARFLQIIRAEVFERPASPYLRLLKLAGCEFSDLQAGLSRNGLEQTLDELARNGVYLTDAEFRGRSDVVRSGQSFRVSLKDFEPVTVPPGLFTQTSGSTGSITYSFSSLPSLAYESSVGALFLQAHDLLGSRHAAYDSPNPGSGGIAFLFILAKAGVTPERWFTPHPPERRLKGAYVSLLASEVALAARRFGPGFPRPERVELDRIDRVVNWAARHHERGSRTCIRAVASGATRIAHAAWELGTSLQGVTFVASGEPITEAKRRVIERVGARLVVIYGFEPGSVRTGYGCAHRRYLDEMHVPEIALAVVPHPRPVSVGGQTVRPLLFTTLDPCAAYIRLNTEIGDYATLERRQCGCALGEAGLNLLLHDVGSHEKFTSEGLNYDFSLLFNVVEETLPSEFGGSLGDYQIQEEEDGEGRTRLTLLAHPAIGYIDEERLLSRLLAEIAKGPGVNRGAASTWASRQTLRVRREPPRESERGKILPLRLARP